MYLLLKNQETACLVMMLLRLLSHLIDSKKNVDTVCQNTKRTKLPEVRAPNLLENTYLDNSSSQIKTKYIRFEWILHVLPY